tara:strand:+ start:809 stop:1159 length:351 start_codon:yes stop_codon:yes gene_type:complete
MPERLEKYNWSEWRNFPDPRKGEYLIAPIGKGLYQLFNKKTSEYILFGTSLYCSLRMSSLLPKPHGQGTRNNKFKREYVIENIADIKYRTVAFLTEVEMKGTEREIRKMKLHKYNT